MQKKHLFAALVIVVSAWTIAAQERIALSAPESLPNNVHYEMRRFTIEFDNVATPDDEGRIYIHLAGVERPIQVACVYSDRTTPTATSLINPFNKANLGSAYAGNATTGSLKQRIHHRLVVMNEAPAVCGRSLAGSLTGNPQ